MSDADRIESENRAMTLKNFDVSAVYDFCLHHRVEVLLMADLQYGCYIDYKEGENACWGSDIHPLGAMLDGIRCYNNNPHPGGPSGVEEGWNIL